MSFPDHGRVLFSATLVRGHIAKFHIPYLRWFKERGWETWVAARNDYPDGVCDIPYCDCFVDIDFARSPFSTRTFTAYRQLRDLFARERFDIVHTHTPVGSVLTRLAARDARRTGTRVIYTAHGFHFYKGAPLANWLLWYPVERAMSRLTDVLITINHEDYERAKKFAHCRVEYAPGVGVDLSRFAAVKYRDAKRKELGLTPGDFAMLSVGDLIPRKNQAAIVRTLPLLPENAQLIVCGEGPERERLLALAGELGVGCRVSLLGFRDDIADIMAACDCLVFPSVHEGLPVSVMEAMASGLPVVASPIRGIDPDLLSDGESGVLLPDDDPTSIASAISGLMGNPALRARLSDGAVASVRRYGLEEALAATSRIYEGGGCSMLTRAELCLAPGDFAVLTIGDLNDNKNHRVLVEALAKLPSRVKLLIAGDGPLRGELSALATRLGVSDRVRLLGFRRDVAALLNACDLFCLPSRREGLPVSLIEAMATGTPVLASNARGCADVLDELGESCIVPENDSESWADAIGRLTGRSHVPNPEHLRTRAARFGVDAVLIDYVAIYIATMIGPDARLLHRSIRLPKEGEV